MSYISVSSKPLNTQKNNKKCKNYKSEDKLKSNKRINKTVIKSHAKIFPIYN